MPFKPDSASGGAATRATKLTSVSSFKLYAYNSSGTAIANGVTYTKSGSSWTTTSKVFWPQTGNVTFYAFSPASNSSVTFNTPSKTLTYTAPTGESSQQDVLYAYKTSARPTNNTVDLTFNHANAAFSVNARLATGCTATVNVSGVQLVNVKPTNTLTFTNGNATASGNNISSTLACSAKTLTTSNQAISSSPLIIPPQSVTAWNGTSALANTYLAVTCKVSENDNYVVGSASTTGTVYVPMDKTLNKGEDNSVNLVFGTLSDGKRSYGRDANGNRIVVSETKTISNITSADIGKVICTDGVSVYNTVAEATAAGKTAAAMIAYVSGTGHGLAIALSDVEKYDEEDDDYTYIVYYNDVKSGEGYTPEINGYSWKLPSRDDWNNMINGCIGGMEEYNGNDYDEMPADGLRYYLLACGGTNVRDHTAIFYLSSNYYEDNSDEQGLSTYYWKFCFTHEYEDEAGGSIYGWLDNTDMFGYARYCIAF